MTTATRPRRNSSPSWPRQGDRDHGDATQAKLVAQSTATEIVRDHGDATQAKLARMSAPFVVRENNQRIAARSNSLVVRDHGDAEQAKLDAKSYSSPSVGDIESTSGSGLNVPDLAIGFGLGILLAAGLWFGMRVMKVRQPAH